MASPDASAPPSDRLESWKEIAAYLRRDVTTVQRWERREDLPVHRHQHQRLASVYAYPAELDAWRRRRECASTAWRPDADGPDIRPPRLPGREPLLSAFAVLLARAHAGARQIALVEGEAGVGKSVLMAALASAVPPGTAVAVGTCRSRSGAAASGGALRELLTGLGERPGDALAVPRLVATAVTTVERLAAARLVLVAIEDLHQADAASLDVVAALARRTTPARLLLVASYRPTDLRSAAIRQVLADPHAGISCSHLVVRLLGVPDVTEWLVALGEWEAPAAVARLLHERTEGNPLWMQHVLRGWQARGLVRQRDGLWTVDMPRARRAPLPPSLWALIDDHLAPLHGLDRRALAAAAAERPVATVDGVARRLGLRPPCASLLLESLVSRGYLRSNAATDGYVFVHRCCRERLAPGDAVG